MPLTVQDVVLEASSKNIRVTQQGQDADGNAALVVFYGYSLSADGFTFQTGDIDHASGDFYSYNKIYANDLAASVNPITFDDENALTAQNLVITSTTGFSPISLEVDAYFLNKPGDTLTFTAIGPSGFIGQQTFDINLTGGYQVLQFDSSFTDVTRLSTTGLSFSPLFVFDNFIADVACFHAGTRIATERGEIPVEDLLPGDRAITADGPVLPVVWVGHRRVDCRSHPHPESVRPVRVRAGAFGTGLPHHDLLLSPDHAIYFDDKLIPVRHLINGVSIVQEAAEAVVYYHVELSDHAVVLAEGLPCESYLDTGDRACFTGERLLKHGNPSLARWVREGEAYAPLDLRGTGVEAVRGHLLAQARATQGDARTPVPAI